MRAARRCCPLPCQLVDGAVEPAPRQQLFGDTGGREGDEGNMQTKGERLENILDGCDNHDSTRRCLSNAVLRKLEMQLPARKWPSPLSLDQVCPADSEYGRVLVESSRQSREAVSQCSSDEKS